MSAASAFEPMPRRRHRSVTITSTGMGPGQRDSFWPLTRSTTKPVLSVAMSADGKTVFSGTADEYVVRWRPD